MKEIKTITGRGLPLTIDDIDTDRIIPARYLRCVSFDGIGEYAFYDERYNTDGSLKDFPMNVPMYEKASIILSGHNFGCGSSREHAPQSLKRAGFQAIIAESFAEIFFGNALTIGLVCVTMKKADIATMCRHIAGSPDLEIVISLTKRTAHCNGIYYAVNLPESARTALLDGSYDLMRELLSHKAEIAEMNAGLPY